MHIVVDEVTVEATLGAGRNPWCLALCVCALNQPDHQSLSIVPSDPWQIQLCLLSTLGFPASCNGHLSTYFTIQELLYLLCSIYLLRVDYE